MNKIRVSEWVFVLCLLLLAFGLRVSGIHFGQPDPQYSPSLNANQMLHYQTPLHPDEFHQVVRPLRMAVTRSLNPEFLENPSFLINLNFVTFWLTDSGRGIDPAGWSSNARENAPFSLYVIGRLYSVLGGLLAVAATYAIARWLSGRFAAASAGLLIAVSFPMVQHAHYATTSSLAGGFAALCIWASLVTFQGKRPRGWIFALAGIAAGLAAGSRYNAAGVSLVVFFTGLYLLYRQRTRRMWLLVLAGWLLFPLAFLISTPYAVLDFERFAYDFNYISNQYVGGESGLAVSLRGLLFEYAYLGVYGLGIPGAIMAVVGLAAAFRGHLQHKGSIGKSLQRAQYIAPLQPSRDSLGNEPSRQVFILIVLIYLAAYSLIVLRTQRPLMAEQMLLPVLPVFALLAGMGAAWIYRCVEAYRPWSAPVLMTVLVAMPLAFSAHFVGILNQPETRYTMQAWIDQHIPRGAYIQLNGPYNVPLDAADYRTTQTFSADTPNVDDLRAAGVEYLLRSDAMTLGAQIAPDGRESSEWQTLAAYDALLDDTFIVVARVERPPWFGSDWFMNSAAFWHDPGLTLYCITPASCAAVR